MPTGTERHDDACLPRSLFRGIADAIDAYRLRLQSKRGDDNSQYGQGTTHGQMKSPCYLIFTQTLPFLEDSTTAATNFMPRTPSSTVGKSSSSAVGFFLSSRARMVSVKFM